MAVSFREFPWYIQALLFVALAVLLIGAGEFVPYSPVQQVRSNLERLNADYTRLNQEVTQLQVYDRRYAEFRAEMDALQKQLDTLRTIVPEEKELDEFMRLLQGAASSSNVQIRRLTAQPVSAREYHYEMPFELQVDGPYFSILDFFSRLSRLSRIINVGDIAFSGIGEARMTKYPLRPGTTVTGTFTATTFFTKAAEQVPGAAAAKQPGKR
jgi:type IV pilus assembly protein PilO